MEISSITFALVTVEVSLLFPDRDQKKPIGETEPTAEELLSPGGATLETFSEQQAGRDVSIVSEVYNDFDYSLVPGPGMFSYGEYVPSSKDINFGPFAERAEACAKAVSGVENILAREWYCTTHPDLAVVHLYYA